MFTARIASPCALAARPKSSPRHAINRELSRVITVTQNSVVRYPGFPTIGSMFLLKQHRTERWRSLSCSLLPQEHFGIPVHPNDIALLDTLDNNESGYRLWYLVFHSPTNSLPMGKHHRNIL